MISGIRFSAQGLYPIYELLFLTLGLGSLSKDDGYGDENGRKTIGWDYLNNFARASRLHVHHAF